MQAVIPGRADRANPESSGARCIPAGFRIAARRASSGMT
jgi:hypothetical protein